MALDSLRAGLAPCHSRHWITADELAAFAAEVLADANAALSQPVTDDVRAAWLDMLALVEDLLALRQQLSQARADALLGRH